MYPKQAARTHLIDRIRNDRLDHRRRFDAAYEFASGFGYRTPEQVVDAVFPLALEGGEPVPVETFDLICDAVHRAEIDAFRARKDKDKEVIT